MPLVNQNITLIEFKIIEVRQVKNCLTILEVVKARHKGVSQSLSVMLCDLTFSLVVLAEKTARTLMKFIDDTVRAEVLQYKQETRDDCEEWCSRNGLKFKK